MRYFLEIETLLVYDRLNYLIKLATIYNVLYVRLHPEIIHPDSDLIAVCNACVDVQEKARPSALNYIVN